MHLFYVLTLFCAVKAFDLLPRGRPANATDVKVITSPGGATIRYKQPGGSGMCETMPGVNEYSGYVDLDNATHMFFIFVEARKDPANAPLTLWLNGGPGSDSLIAFFQELGPCNVTKELKTQLNPYAWNEVSNMLFLSQPIGVGFSYSFKSSDSSGTYSELDPAAAVGTTDQAAVAAWHVLQGFLANLPKLDSKITSKTFNLWTESYGGHYGPSFYSHFMDQNAAIANGTQNGTQLVMDTLGIINGIIDEKIQAPYYPEFAVNNTYGIKAVNDTVYSQMKAAYYDPGQCRDKIDACSASANKTSPDGLKNCRLAEAICRYKVEYPYYDVSGRGTYDIRYTGKEPDPPLYFVDFLNLDSTQNALGVNMNYTSDSSDTVGVNFELTGDFIFETMMDDLEDLLNKNVRVALFYGDADYICNWFGGEAVSMQVNYTHSADFRAAPYSPFMVDNVEYGKVRQHGNFSFTRIYESGHEIPYYQPKASLEFFRRALGKKAISDGFADVTTSYSTNGTSGTGDIQSSSSVSPSASSTGAAATASPSKSAGDRRIKMFWRWD
ncbi:Carboxypeptidase S1-like protein [Lachnellula hyalina]|uniref:Carboxypeptidase n=1 Tax=Lachnellula hyalina TaxID=1316788 RepID=A0A8H8TTZ0_9HELO|nr:Carboxypeptidase S1-like protein [Lachnellula hyalina]TVY22284.1 Carboxypeptidase S1-like protein [Lachnellula hyalina]